MAELRVNVTPRAAQQIKAQLSKRAQSNPSSGADEKARDLSNLANPSTMAAYYADLRLFFARATGSSPVVLHV
ncbi:MAG: hypothetical protein ACXWLM_05945, partial [Myxococcales bacterium]